MYITLPEGTELEITDFDARLLADQIKDRLGSDSSAYSDMAHYGITLLQRLGDARHALGICQLSGIGSQLSQPFSHALGAGFSRLDLRTLIDYEVHRVGAGTGKTSYLTPRNLCYAATMTERVAAAHEWAAGRAEPSGGSELRAMLQTEWTGRRYTDEEWAVIAVDLPPLDKAEIGEVLTWLRYNAEIKDQKPPTRSAILRAVKFARRAATSTPEPVADAVPATEDEVAELIAGLRERL